LSRRRWLSLPAGAWVELFRGLPLLLLILFIFLGLPAAGVTVSTFWALVAGLTLYNSAVIGEIFRAGILSLPRGQTEAAYAIGLRRGQTLRLILIPQAVRRMLPALISQLVTLLKDTSLGFVIAYAELLRTGRNAVEFLGGPYSIPVYTKDEAGKGDPYPDMVKAEPILNGFRGLPLNEVGPSLVNLKVRNGSGQEGQAMNVAGAFQKIGFKVQVEPGAEPEPLARTTVYYAPGQAAFGQRVARHLTAGAELQERSDLRAGEVVLVTGTDFSTVHEEPVPLDQLNTTTTATPAAGAGDTGSTASTTATTAKPPAKTTPTTAPQTATTTPQVGYAAGQPPPGKTCG